MAALSLSGKRCCGEEAAASVALSFCGARVGWEGGCLFGHFEHLRARLLLLGQAARPLTDLISDGSFGQAAMPRGTVEALAAVVEAFFNRARSEIR